MKTTSLLDSGLNVKDWLSGFDTADRPTAELLLSSIQFVTRTEFTKWTVQTIQEIADGSQEPIAVFAVREVQRDSSLFFVDPNCRPEAAPGSDVGSEGMVAHLLKSLARRDKRILNHPSIGALQEHKVLNVVLVDDMVGTGSTATSYLAAFYNHPTIRSWISRKLLTFHLVAYAQQAAGLERISKLCSKKKHPGKILLEIGKETRFLTRYWARVFPPTQVVSHRATSGTTLAEMGPRNRLSRIRKLSSEYGKRWQIPKKWRFGYGESLATIAFEHGCSNNVPGLIWYDSKSGPSPLVSGRLPVVSAVLSRDDIETPVDATIQEEEFILNCTLRGVRHASAISRRTGLAPEVVHMALGRLREKGLIDADRRPLPQALRRPRSIPGCVVPGPVPYLPRSLKGPDDVR